MSIYYVDSFERVHFDVKIWLDSALEEIRLQKIQIIECKKFIEPEDESIVVLSLSEFIKICRSIDQKAIFLYKENSLIEEGIRQRIKNACEETDGLDFLIQAFKEECSEIFSQAELVCSECCHLQIFFSFGRIIVVAGVINETYEELMDAVDIFCDEIEVKRQVAKELKDREDEEKLLELSDELFRDSEFSSLRGKRKRCVYVLERYADRIPESNYFRRPDAYSDLFEKNIVDLVERVSDRLEALKRSS